MISHPKFLKSVCTKFSFFADSKGSTPLHYVAQFYITSNPDDEKMDKVIESIDVLFKDEEETADEQAHHHPEDHQASDVSGSQNSGSGSVRVPFGSGLGFEFFFRVQVGF